MRDSCCNAPFRDRGSVTSGGEALDALVDAVREVRLAEEPAVTLETAKGAARHMKAEVGSVGDGVGDRAALALLGHAAAGIAQDQRARLRRRAVPDVHLAPGENDSSALRSPVALRQDEGAVSPRQV